MAKVQRGDQGLSISLKGALRVLSCPEMLLSAWTWGWEPVDQSLYILHLNQSFCGWRIQLTDLFSC